MGAKFTDAILLHGKNGQAPRGALQSAIARGVRGYQHAGRVLYQMWGGAVSTGASLYRIVHPNWIDGGSQRMRAAVHVSPSGAALTATTGVIIDGEGNTWGSGYSTDYPENVQPLEDLHPDPTDDVVSGDLEEKTFGTDNLTLNGICVYEDAIPDPTPANTVDPSKFASTRDVLATQAGSYGSNARLTNRFDHVWRMRRPVINWSALEPNYIAFTASSQAYRYIFDQTVGTGGTAPAVDGPAMTLPCKSAGIGFQNTVRVYVRVYAAMSGATDGGTIAIANKDSNGDMQVMQALQNPETIGGTGYAWYPSLGTFDPENDAYFEAPTGVDFDRICLGGRSEGATDTLRIKAFAMFVYPSML